MQNYLAEFIGTLVFIFMIVATGNPLIIGATLCIVIYATSKISGGNMNPAVSIAMYSAGKLPFKDLIPYCVAQILGGLTAIQLYKLVK
jgi:aquaporin Z